MKLTQIIATATTAAVLGTAGVSIAGAATSSTSSSAASAKQDAPATAGEAKAKHSRLRRLGRHAIGLSAKTIGISRADLVKDLRAGKTIAAVAAAHHVTSQKVVDALMKAGTAKIEAAEKAGKLDATRAARLQKRLPNAAQRFVEQWHPKQKAA